MRSMSPRTTHNHTNSQSSKYSYSAAKSNKRSKSPKASMKSVTEVSTIYADYRQHNETGHCTSSSRYCEVCKWKSWRKESLNYNPVLLLNNRDMIKQIHCLGCENKYDSKLFIDHAPDCRRSNNVPPINLNTVFSGDKEKKLQNSRSYFGSLGNAVKVISSSKVDLANPEFKDVNSNQNYSMIHPYSARGTSPIKDANFESPS